MPSSTRGRGPADDLRGQLADAGLLDEPDIDNNMGIKPTEQPWPPFAMERSERGQSEREAAFQQAAHAELHAAGQRRPSAGLGSWSPEKGRVPKWQAGDAVGFFHDESRQQQQPHMRSKADAFRHPSTTQSSMVAELEAMELPPHLQQADQQQRLRAEKRSVQQAHEQLDALALSPRQRAHSLRPTGSPFGSPACDPAGAACSSASPSRPGTRGGASAAHTYDDRISASRGGVLEPIDRPTTKGVAFDSPRPPHDLILPPPTPDGALPAASSRCAGQHGSRDRTAATRHATPSGSARDIAEAASSFSAEQVAAAVGGKAAFAYAMLGSSPDFVRERLVQHAYDQEGGVGTGPGTGPRLTVDLHAARPAMPGPATFSTAAHMVNVGNRLAGGGRAATAIGGARSRGSPLRGGARTSSPRGLNALPGHLLPATPTPPLPLEDVLAEPGPPVAGEAVQVKQRRLFEQLQQTIRSLQVSRGAHIASRICRM